MLLPFHQRGFENTTKPQIPDGVLSDATPQLILWKYIGIIIETIEYPLTKFYRLHDNIDTDIPIGWTYELFQDAKNTIDDLSLIIRDLTNDSRVNSVIDAIACTAGTDSNECYIYERFLDIVDAKNRTPKNPFSARNMNSREDFEAWANTVPHTNDAAHDLRLAQILGIDPKYLSPEKHKEERKNMHEICEHIEGFDGRREFYKPNIDDIDIDPTDPNLTAKVQALVAHAYQQGYVKGYRSGSNDIIGYCTKYKMIKSNDAKIATNIFYDDCINIKYAIRSVNERVCAFNNISKDNQRAHSIEEFTQCLQAPFAFNYAKENPEETETDVKNFMSTIKDES